MNAKNDQNVGYCITTSDLPLIFQIKYKGVNVWANWSSSILCWRRPCHIISMRNPFSFCCIGIYLCIYSMNTICLNRVHHLNSTPYNPPRMTPVDNISNLSITTDLHTLWLNTEQRIYLFIYIYIYYHVFTDDYWVLKVHVVNDHSSFKWSLTSFDFYKETLHQTYFLYILFTSRKWHLSRDH